MKKIIEKKTKYILAVFSFYLSLSAHAFANCPVNQQWGCRKIPNYAHLVCSCANEVFTMTGEFCAGPWSDTELISSSDQNRTQSADQYCEGSRQQAVQKTKAVYKDFYKVNQGVLHCVESRAEYYCE